MLKFSVIGDNCLELLSGENSIEGIVLSDVDHTSVAEGSFKKINTVKHYNVSCYKVVNDCKYCLILRGNDSKFFYISKYLTSNSLVTPFIPKIKKPLY